jgi:hypothetical protein
MSRLICLFVVLFYLLGVLGIVVKLFCEMISLVVLGTLIGLFVPLFCISRPLIGRVIKLFCTKYNDWSIVAKPLIGL